MLKHDDSGALGLVINRVLAEGSIASLLKMFGLESEDSGRKIRVLYGGPVEPQTGFVLHSTDYVSEGTQLVTDRVAVTTNLYIINAISAGQGPKLSLIALGYAGWGRASWSAKWIKRPGSMCRLKKPFCSIRNIQPNGAAPWPSAESIYNPRPRPHPSHKLFILRWFPSWIRNAGGAELARSETQLKRALYRIVTSAGWR